MNTYTLLVESDSSLVHNPSSSPVTGTYADDDQAVFELIRQSVYPLLRDSGQVAKCVIRAQNGVVYEGVVGRR